MLPPPRRGPAYKTKLCALWQRGHCDRDTCSFAHGNNELRRPPPSRSSFPHHPGRRDYRGSDFRGRIDRRFSPRRRHSPGRDFRGHRALHDRRPTSRERESSYSRSPSRKSERRHDKKTDDGETNSSRSLSASDNNDDTKKEKFSIGDEKEDHEKQLKQIRQDMDVLREDKSHLEIFLDEKINEMRSISSKVNDLEQQLKREKDECHRMTSKMKKFIKAHARFLKAQEELKRSQGRFERLGDLLASDILKRGANEEVSSVNVDEDPIGSYERSPNATATKKRSVPYSASDEAKAAKKRRERDSDTITRPEKYKSEVVTTDFDKTSKGTEGTKSFYLKKRLWEDEKNKLVNVPTVNVFADKVKDSPLRHVLPSTGMATHAIDDLNEAVDLEDRHEVIDALDLNEVDDRTISPVMAQPLPVVQNAYEQYEADDEEVDVE